MAKRRRSSATENTKANIHIHAHGTIMRSLVTADMVEVRARELALIAGRDPKRVTASDRIQAKLELLGDDSADGPVDDSGILASGMGAPPTSTGVRIKPQLPTDDETEIQTVQEGVDAAEHDEMVQAARARNRE